MNAGAPAAGSGVEICFRLAAVRRVLIAGFVLLVFLGLIAEGLEHILLERDAHGFVPTFQLAAEGNVPTWYSAALLLACSGLLAMLARSGGRAGAHPSRAWSVLALAFLWISLDEVAVLHERLTEPVGELVGRSGPFFYGWVIPVGLGTIAVALFCLALLRRLPRVTARAFLMAGALYVGGALGTEVLIGWWETRGAEYGFYYGLAALGQEALEIAGVSIFLLALLRYAGGETLSLSLRASARGAAPSSDRAADDLP